MVKREGPLLLVATRFRFSASSPKLESLDCWQSSVFVRDRSGVICCVTWRPLIRHAPSHHVVLQPQTIQSHNVRMLDVITLP